MNGTDQWEREGRWLGYHRSHARYWRNIANDIAGYVPEIAARWREQADTTDEWLSKIGSKVSGARIVERPSMPEILAEFKIGPMYLAYRLTSQIIHGAPPAAEYVAKDEYHRTDAAGIARVFESNSRTLLVGEFVTPEDWAGVLKMASFGVTRAVGDLALVCEVPAEALSPFNRRHFDLLDAAERFAPSVA